jgi:RNA processing factor Prp31
MPEDPSTIAARIDALEARVIARIDALESHLETRADPAWRSILTAPPDDEPYTPDQQREDAEARAAIARGEGIPHEQVLREFGLL